MPILSETRQPMTTPLRSQQHLASHEAITSRTGQPMVTLLPSPQLPWLAIRKPGATRARQPVRIPLRPLTPSIFRTKLRWAPPTSKLDAANIRNDGNILFDAVGSDQKHCGPAVHTNTTLNIQEANSSPALLTDNFVDTPRETKYIACGCPPSLAK